jgi:N-acetylglucosamine-6-phosphate deacetylase
MYARMNQSSPANSILLRARIVAPDRVIEQGAIFIQQRRIVSIFDSPAAVLPDAESVIDLSGSTLYPGFIDLHIHGAAGVDTMAAGAADLLRVSEFLARNGVTAWLPTLVPASTEQYRHAVQAIEQAVAQTSVCDSNSRSQDDDHRLESMPRARILGVHYEGPFVNSAQCGALHREHFRTFTGGADLDELPTIENEASVRMMTVAPEIDGGIELIGELRQRGWVVSVGHTRATPEILDQAREAGAHHMTHFMNAMAPLHHRAPGPVGWGLINDDVSMDVIADGVHLDPLMLKVLLRCVTPLRLALISDAIAAAGQGDGDYEIWGEKISVKDGRTRNARGSIAGSVITMLDAVRTMRSLGAAEFDVARMASLNPASLLGLERDCGSIEVGKRADLVALDDDGNVRMTIVGGQTAFEARR